MDYFDEAGSDCQPQSGEEQQPNVYEVAAFTTKKLYIEGMTAYTDEFPSRARTFSRSVVSVSTSSSPESKVSDTLQAASCVSMIKFQFGGVKR